MGPCVGFFVFRRVWEGIIGKTQVWVRFCAHFGLSAVASVLLLILLSAAYHGNGIEEIAQHCSETFEKLGKHQVNNLSLNELLNGER